MIVELLVTLKGDRTYNKGEFFHSPLPGDIAAEVSLDRGTIRIISSDPKPTPIVEVPVEFNTPINTEPTPVVEVTVEPVQQPKPKRVVRKRKKIG